MSQSQQTNTSIERGRPADQPTRWHRVVRVVRVVAGTVLALLGLLWVLQGTDVVRIPPIACAADCQVISGGSLRWTVIGVLTLIAGLLLLGVQRRRRA